MAKRAKKKPYQHAAVAETAEYLKTRRAVRRRKAGDGEGVDIGIANCFGALIEDHLTSLPQATRERLLDHVRSHVDEALKPILRILERSGSKAEDVDMFRDLGPNMFRTIIEHLEQKK